MIYKKSTQITGVLICILFYVALVMNYRTPEIQAQVRISDTPVRVVIPEETQITPQAGVLTPTPTFTPTEPPPSVFLEAAAAPGDLIVLDFPETGTYLGSLETGRQYPITGQYFSWLQFEYPPGPNGLGWIYLDTVRISGNVAEINIISNPSAANASPEDNQTATTQAELLTPSVAETASAEARVLIIPTVEATQSGNQAQFLPTFTAPPDIVERVPTQVADILLEPTPTRSLVEQAVSIADTGNIPPILPILVIGGFGILGLLVAIARS